VKTLQVGSSGKQEGRELYRGMNGGSRRTDMGIEGQAVAAWSKWCKRLLVVLICVVACSIKVQGVLLDNFHIFACS